MCVQIDDSDGRGVRNDDLDGFDPYMPRPTTTFSGHEGSRWTVELFLDGTSVREDSEAELRHLKLISENIARSTEALYGSTSGSKAGSLTTPNR